ncbi:DUF4405 domain-containing protein [Chengkuizengella axinellae]|uniref:DUF4405 domain-containing protein n=1 Tax=Chengkuizengella axinellae TaxID=3064388 RepID=A0ABT9J217_9BACL|nr:DUF4405 domain-containing protein [Chengkuizengella sp. 2205SS18-9]MDP5275637.1 DUF4405 domain-containing protein [Chengkuizengella sp. 2205SS18-9]
MRKNRFKFCFDLSMAITFILIFAPAVTSVAFHEIASIFLGVAFIVHLVLNKDWIIGMSKKIFSKSIKGKSLLSYLLNMTLLVDMLIIMVSGLLVSEVVLPNFRYFTDINWLALHIISSVLGLLIVGIHLGLHWNWIKQIGSQFSKLKKIVSFRKPYRKVLLRILLIIGTVFLFAQVFKLTSSTIDFFSGPSLEESGGAEGDKNLFSVNLIGILPIFAIYACLLGSVAFYTHLLEKRAMNKNHKRTS